MGQLLPRDVPPEGGALFCGKTLLKLNISIAIIYYLGYLLEFLLRGGGADDPMTGYVNVFKAKGIRNSTINSPKKEGVTKITSAEQDISSLNYTVFQFKTTQ